MVGSADINEDIIEVLYTREQIREAAQELGARISADDAGKELLLVGILKGGVYWLTELSQAISIPCEIDFMAVSSYGNSTQSSGVVRVIKDVADDLTGYSVIIVEDVIDSGVTLDYLLKDLRSRNAESVEIAVLLRKRGMQKVDVACRYEAFEAPGAFLVGFGLDYAESYRNLPYIGVLKPEVYA